MYFGAILMKKATLLLIILTVAVSGCALGGNNRPQRSFAFTPGQSAAASETPSAVPVTATPTASPVPPTATPLPTATPPSQFPTVTLTQDAICRKGPDKRYFILGNIAKGQTTQVNGKNTDASWISVERPGMSGSYCWVPASDLDGLNDTSALRVLTVQQLPPLPTGVTAGPGHTPGEVCGSSNHLVLRWLAQDGIGYHIYRNGKNIATVYNDYYIDFDTPGSSKPYVYTYTVEAFNGAGVSNPASLAVTICG